ncbi:hypothetical protein M3Y98_00749100 [Aphelenchoides besseyi]|nr:hypothetical protein M3Y98_00749100 [Aphelenchoides besseyi]
MMAMYCESKRFLPVLVDGFQTELLEKTLFSQLQNWLRLARATINVPSVSSTYSRTKRYEEITVIEKDGKFQLFH